MSEQVVLITGAKIALTKDTAIISAFGETLPKYK